MELQMSENINELAKALAAAQGEMEMAKKDKKNEHFNYKYADLACCLEVCREPLSKNGLAVIQIPSNYDNTNRKIKIVTLLCHSSGQYIKGEIEMVVAKPDAQGIGGAITYGRRYSLCAMVGIAQDDDDGNTASGIEPKQQAQQPKQQAQPKPQTQPKQQIQPKQQAQPKQQNTQPVEKQPEVVTSVHNDGNVRFINGATCQVRNTHGQYLDIENISDGGLQDILGMDMYSASHEAIKAVLDARSIKK